MIHVPDYLFVCDPGGRLVTVFSAPDYPQFMAEGEHRHNNRAAVLHLTAPDYTTPQVESFEADLPRPQVSLCVISNGLVTHYMSMAACRAQWPCACVAASLNAAAHKHCAVL